MPIRKRDQPPENGTHMTQLRLEGAAHDMLIDLRDMDQKGERLYLAALDWEELMAVGYIIGRGWMQYDRTNGWHVSVEGLRYLRKRGD